MKMCKDLFFFHFCNFQKKNNNKDVNVYWLVQFLVFPRWGSVPKCFQEEDMNEVDCNLHIVLMSQKMVIFLISHS